MTLVFLIELLFIQCIEEEKQKKKSFFSDREVKNEKKNMKTKY